MGQLNSSPLKFCLSRLKQISRELEFGSTQFLATLSTSKGSISPTVTSYFLLNVSHIVYMSINGTYSMYLCPKKGKFLPLHMRPLPY